MLGLKLNHVSKKGYWKHFINLLCRFIGIGGAVLRLDVSVVETYIDQLKEQFAVPHHYQKQRMREECIPYSAHDTMKNLFIPGAMYRRVPSMAISQDAISPDIPFVQWRHNKPYAINKCSHHHG